MQKKIENHKIKKYLVLVFIIFILVLYFSLKDNYLDILKALSSVKVGYLILGILCVFISKSLIGVIVYFLAKKEKTDTKLSKMLHIEFIYPFFAGITPGSLGGESFEILYLKDTGISYGAASNITIQKYILYEMALMTVNLCALIINIFTDIISLSGFVTFAVTINFLVNGVILLVLFLLAYSKKFKYFILNKGLVFLNKIRIIKDLDKTKEKIDSYLKNFDLGASKLKSDKKLFIKLYIISILSLVFLILAAYPIARSLSINNISGLNLFVLSTFVKMISLLIFTPGNSGGAEYSFIYLFSNLIDNNTITAYMLIWRFVTYYIPLIGGGILAMMWRKDDKNE